MLVYHNDLKERLAISREHSMRLVANGLDQYQSLESRLEYLKTYANQDDPQHTRCHLYWDFVDYSFGWTMYRIVAPGLTKAASAIQSSDDIGRLHPDLIGYRPWLSGGLIYHRDYNDPDKGSWSIHT